MAKRKKKGRNFITKIIDYFEALLAWIILAFIALIIGFIPVLNRSILEGLFAPDYLDYD